MIIIMILMVMMIMMIVSYPPNLHPHTPASRLPDRKLVLGRVRSIAETGTKVLVTGGTISEMALHFIERYKVGGRGGGITPMGGAH
jgi:hypothetical protein